MKTWPARARREGRAGVLRAAGLGAVCSVYLVVSTAAAQPLIDRQIPIDGTTIHLRCGGVRPPGVPLVSFEAGAFNTVETWGRVQPEVARFARTCAHDRPGRGLSGLPPAGLDAHGYVRLLSRTLRAAGEPPPYVLVGHSMGGLIAQLFVVDRPDEIAGLVLVDSSHPGQSARLARLPSGSALTPGPPPPAPGPEVVSFEAFAAALGSQPPRVTRPVAVLSRSRWTNGSDGPDDRARLAVWQDLQRELAASAPGARHVIATDAGHYVQNDAPALVIDAVRRIIERRD